MVMRNKIRYVFTSPRWVLLVEVISGLLRLAVAFGPVFSNQVWSII